MLWEHIDLFLLQTQNVSQTQNPGTLLLNEAVSNYVVFALGIVVGVIGWLIVNFISQKKPQIIEVIKKEQVSLLKIDSQVEKDIKLEYKGHSITSLHRTALSLFNRGEETSNDLTFTIQTDNPDLQNEILDKVIVDASENEVKDASILLSGKNFEITIKFLNPFKRYRDQLTLYIFSSNPLKIKDAKGRGPGWGVAYFDQVAYQKDLEEGVATAFAGGSYNFALGLTKSLGVVITRFIR